MVVFGHTPIEIMPSVISVFQCQCILVDHTLVKVMGTYGGGTGYGYFVKAHILLMEVPVLVIHGAGVAFPILYQNLINV